MTQRIALISNGVVDNVIIGDLGFAQTLGYDAAVDVTSLFEDNDPTNPGPGWTYDGTTFSPPVTPEPTIPNWSDPDLNPEYWWLDVGPFYDRFAIYGNNTIKLTILAAATPYCRAAINDSNVRKYIDLKRSDLPVMLGLIKTEVPALTDEMIAAILESPTTDYERHIKGLVQPNGT